MIVKRALKTVLLLMLVLACIDGAQAQRRKVIYLQTYDWAPYHFGFHIGANFMDYNLMVKEDFQNQVYTNFNDLPNTMNITRVGFQSYQILGIARATDSIFSSTPRPGFSVGVIGDLRLGEYFNLRFSPTFSLSEINIDYSLQINYEDDTLYRVVQSLNPHVNCLEFPLHVKYRSKRYNNIGFYLIAGFNPKLYFTFSKSAKDWLQTKPFDVALEMGTGLDIYNQWFKMGVEIKLGLGLMNAMANDQVYYYGNPLEKLKNKQLQISFTFE